MHPVIRHIKIRSILCWSLIGGIAVTCAVAQACAIVIGEQQRHAAPWERRVLVIEDDCAVVYYRLSRGGGTLFGRNASVLRAPNTMARGLLSAVQCKEARTWPSRFSMMNCGT